MFSSAVHFDRTLFHSQSNRLTQKNSAKKQVHTLQMKAQITAARTILRKDFAAYKKVSTQYFRALELLAGI